MDAWRGLDEIETKEPILSANQIQELRQSWRQRLTITAPICVKMAIRNVSLNNAATLELVVSVIYRRNENFPEVVIKHSSGNEVLDKAIAKNFSTSLLMPSPPIFEKSRDTYEIAIPINFAARENQS